MIKDFFLLLLLYCLGLPQAAEADQKFKYLVAYPIVSQKNNKTRKVLFFLVGIFGPKAAEWDKLV